MLIFLIALVDIVLVEIALVGDPVYFLERKYVWVHPVDASSVPCNPLEHLTEHARFLIWIARLLQLD